MSELVWDIKNGELDSVKNEIEKKVILEEILSSQTSYFSHYLHLHYILQPNETMYAYFIQVANCLVVSCERISFY